MKNDGNRCEQTAFFSGGHVGPRSAEGGCSEGLARENRWVGGVQVRAENVSAPPPPFPDL